MSFEGSLRIIINFLNENRIPYMVIGGIVNTIYGNPRQTFDIDIKIYISEENSIEEFIKNISGISKILIDNPEEFIKKTYVLPVEIKGVRIDVVFAFLPYEINAIKNSIIGSFEGIEFNVCTPEDLIIQKSISERDKDWQDIEGVVKINKNNLNWEYIYNNVKELSEWISKPGMLQKIIDLRDGK